jgi:hypothetical protein
LNQLAPTTSERYRNKRALKGILEQKIKKVAAPAYIQIQKFDQKWRTTTTAQKSK